MRNLCIFAITLCVAASSMAEVSTPLYRPSSRSVEPSDISTNAYGASPMAPDALNVSETAPDFVLPVVGGGSYRLSQAAQAGPVVIIFYRGHW